GVGGGVSRGEDALLSSPRVVVPDEWELPTSADTGFCPMSSIPVTMPMATTKTATAKTATRDQRGPRSFAGGRLGLRAAGRAGGAAGSFADVAGAVGRVMSTRLRPSFVLRSDSVYSVVLTVAI